MTGSFISCRPCGGSGWRVSYVDVHPYQEDCATCGGEGRLPLPLTAEQALEDTCRWGELRDYYNPAGVPDLDELPRTAARDELPRTAAREEERYGT